MKNNEPMSVEISSDEKVLICRNKDRQIRWQRSFPPILEWRRFLKGNVGDPEGGAFQYADFEGAETICAVFRPAHGLDWNIRYKASNGDITEICETR